MASANKLMAPLAIQSVVELSFGWVGMHTLSHLNAGTRAAEPHCHHGWCGPSIRAHGRRPRDLYDVTSSGPELMPSLDNVPSRSWRAITPSGHLNYIFKP